MSEPQLHSSVNDPVTYCGRRVSNNEKLQLLNNRWVPPPTFAFPISGGHKYNQVWEHDHSWLQYSVSTDAAFCSYCILFGEQLSGKGVHSTVFHTTGFRDWKNAKGIKRGALHSHEATEVHKAATMKALAFKDIAAGTAKDIHSHLSKA